MIIIRRKDRRRMQTLEKQSHDSHPARIGSPRYAFNLRIKADCIEEYELEHTRVWPELLAKLKEVGISDYSIFRRGQDLTLVLRCDNFERAWEELEKDPVNQR